MLQRLKERAISLRGSLIRAVIFAIAWAIFPFWIFLVVALYLFFVPFSQAKSVIVPFLVLMVITALQATGFYAAVIFGAIFWYILLIKELYIVDRKMAYEMLSLALVYLLFRAFYLRAGMGFGGVSVFFALLAAALIGVLFSSFVKNFGEDLPHSRLFRRIAGFVAFFLIFELLLTGLFLPLDFVYQSSVVFLLAALLLELLSKYLFTGTLSRRRVLAVSSTVFALLVVILGSAPWGL